ncbi:MAG: transposase [Nitrosomonas sp.]
MQRDGAYSGLLLFKMLLVGIWNGGLSDESVEDIANSNLRVMRFLGLSLEDDVPDHSVLSRFRTRLTAAGAWDRLLNPINWQIQVYNITVKQGCHVDASITQSPRKPKVTKTITTQSPHYKSPICGRTNLCNSGTLVQYQNTVRPLHDCNHDWSVNCYNGYLKQ